MAIIDFANREIIAKIVYFGASGAGCANNLERLHELVLSDDRSRLHQFGTEAGGERSSYFEYIPPGFGLLTGFVTRFRVYSMSSAVVDEAQRDEVFRGTDAVVFVADARQTRRTANVEALLMLEGALAEQGLELGTLPVVIQVNHIDATAAHGVEEVAEDLNPYGFPVHPAVVRSGQGVIESHDTVTRNTVARIRENFAGHEAAINLTAIHRVHRERDEDVIRRHVQAIEARNQPSPPEDWDPQASGLSKRYLSLPAGETVELAFQPHSYVGRRPVHMIDARFEQDRVQIELVMARVSDGSPRRLSVVLINRPADAKPLPMQLEALPAEPTETASASLPDRVDLPPPPPRDFPPIWYGVAGAAGGATVGLLIGFLLFG